MRTLPALGLAAILSASSWAQTTVLDTYVYTPDPAYSWRIDSQTSGAGYTLYGLRMDSGTWRTAAEVDKPLWQHYLNVYVPDTLLRDTAMLVIEGGSAGNPIGDPLIDAIAGAFATGTGSVLAHLGQVPFQPLTFSDEVGAKTEDAIIAYSWRKFLENPSDDTWPLQLPMARAGVRAMDTMQALIAQIAPSNPLNQFVVGGASKRGWTTWLVGAAENGPLGGGRVKAVVPIVIDALNTEASFIHHGNVYGTWSFAIQDYVDQGIMNWLGTPQIARLFAIVDPFAYLGRLTMDKYIYTASGDEFFLPDSWWFYWEALPGEKRLRTFENAGHSIEAAGILAALEPLGVYSAIVDPNLTVPDYTWQLSPDGTLDAWTSEPAVSAVLWQATNTQAREFRYSLVGPVFTSTPLADLGGGHFQAQVAAPPQGWTAYFIDLDFGGIHFTTGTNVVTRSIKGDVTSVSVFGGGTQQLSLDAGLDNSNRTYLLLGSASGTTPGISLYGQHLPLASQDAYFNFTLLSPNTPILFPSLAFLDEEGQAQPSFNLPPIQDASLVGLTLHHAFAVLGTGVPVVFASAAEPIVLAP